MKKIALTGVIGSGKTTAATFFKDLGIPVFIADDCAKDLMISDSDLKTQIINLLGEYAYINGKLNKEFISEQIFNNKSLLDSVNSLIHPRVQKAFDLWFKNQSILIPHLTKKPDFIKNARLSSNQIQLIILE